MRTLDKVLAMMALESATTCLMIEKSEHSSAGKALASGCSPVVRAMADSTGSSTRGGTRDGEMTGLLKTLPMSSTGWPANGWPVRTRK